MKPSLHLSRPAEPQPTSKDFLEVAVNVRTVEHYELVMGLQGDIDPDL